MGGETADAGANTGLEAWLASTIGVHRVLREIPVLVKKLLSCVGVLAMALAAMTARAQIVAFDNGGVGTDTGWCISGPNQCGAMGGATFTLYNAFTLAEPTHVVGFRNWNATGQASAYVSTNWSVWTGSPAHLLTPLYSGSSVASVISDQGYNRAQVLGLSMELPAGTYWLGVNHVTTQIWSYVAPSVPASGAVFGDGTGWFSEGHWEMAFQVLASPVPEPSGALILPLGFAALWLRPKSRKPTHDQT
jgi:hypothetical protein